MLSGEPSKDNRGMTEANEKTSAKPLKNIVDNNINNWDFLFKVKWDQIKVKSAKVDNVFVLIFLEFI